MTIVQAIAGDSRWRDLEDTPTLLEGVVARDPDPVVSLAALESLRRLRMRELNGLLNERISLAAGRGDTSPTVAQLAEAQERWIALERGSMLPAFMRTPPPASAKPADAPVRVLAFGDFGNGSGEQKMVAQTIATYHQGQRFDFAITLGDNF